MRPDTRDSIERITDARRQFESLSSLVNDYLATDPLTVSTGGWTDSELNLDIKVKVDPPAQVWLTASDIMQRLRQALDNAVHAVAMWNGGDPHDRSRQFPIALKPGHYFGGGRMRHRQLAGVAEVHKRVIDAAQPFNWGKGAKRDALALVADFSNTDKHRHAHRAFPLVLGVGLNVRVQGVQVGRPYVPYSGEFIRVGGGHPIKVAVPGETEVALRGIKAAVGFGERAWQVPDFARCIDVVDSVVQRLSTAEVAPPLSAQSE